MDIQIQEALIIGMTIQNPPHDKNTKTIKSCEGKMQTY